MAWSITDYFPSWGDSGEQPSAGFNYQGGEQVNEKHLDYLWSSLHDIQEELQAALDDIDSDADGVVDEADYANDVDSTAIAGDGLKASGGDLRIEPADFAGSGLTDDGSDNLALSENSLSVIAGDGLKGGGSVNLGGSTTLNIEPSDFAGSGLVDDGNDNLAIDSSAVRQEEWEKITELNFSNDTQQSASFGGSNYDVYRFNFSLEWEGPDGYAVKMQINGNTSSSYSTLKQNGNSNFTDFWNIGDSAATGDPAVYGTLEVYPDGSNYINAVGPLHTWDMDSGFTTGYLETSSSDVSSATIKTDGTEQISGYVEIYGRNK